MADEDNDLWAVMTQDVKPLHPQKPVKKPSAPPSSDKKKPKNEKKDTKKVKDPIPRTRAVPEKSRELDKNTKDKLVRGKLKLEGKIDLHGLRQEEAFQALATFMQNAYDRKRRMVLVITGKGALSVNPEHWMEDVRGVLRQKFPTWMQQAPFKEIVLQYHQARPKDGGEGAFYVYLRKKK